VALAMLFGLAAYAIAAPKRNFFREDHV